MEECLRLDWPAEFLLDGRRHPSVAHYAGTSRDLPVLVQGNLAKFGQHADLREVLLGARELPDPALVVAREKLRALTGPVLIGGAEHRTIHIAEPDPDWPARFQAERARIAAALGETARRIDHIGSTSVPGLGAKPIVDIDVSVPNVDDEDAYLPQLEAVGYVLRVREPEHRMLRTPELDVHVHLCTLGGWWEYRHLLFRDWLCREARDRAAYERLKRELATREWPRLNEYAEAKGELIAEITARARAWADTSGWSVAESG
ncbi:hypothetical protein GCM10010174_53950 [Kutzneria viridogrisea]|uniref:GrpB family protein n=2 Tax=Kutzneria TaxID=43356 RepID=W5W1G6_9PSEU|nr:GrpB family protein [Kutzneria albida]AHH94657.1 protein of unknown function UPF0157 [Kutzneria albida DSM 43870]MBA8930325.1 GrpB-like predicted nucleotidyltransferase (UPF0157 family) [Kutzneria viridogrisea]